MAHAGQLVTKIKELEQVGMVVGDLTERMDAMLNTFGIGPWDVYILEPDSMSDVRYYGKPSHSGMKVGRAKLGPIEIELIEPIGDDNVYRDFVKKFGNGIQHLGWHKTETKEAFAETVRNLEEAGFPSIWSGNTRHSKFAYCDTSKALNTILEVNWWNPAVTPTPNYTYPE